MPLTRRQSQLIEENNQKSLENQELVKIRKRKNVEDISTLFRYYTHEDLI